MFLPRDRFDSFAITSGAINPQFDPVSLVDEVDTKIRFPRRTRVTHPRDIYSINLTRLKSYLPDTYSIQNSRLTTLPPRILRNQAHGTNLTERSLITQFPTKRSFRFIRHADVNRIPRIITYLLCCILSFPRWIPDFNLPLQRTHPLLRSTIYLGRDL